MDCTRFAARGTLALGLCLSLMAPALADARFDRVKTAFGQWADASGVKNASMVLVVDGQIAGKFDRGTYTTATPEPVASESKLITGLCIVHLVGAGQLQFSSTLGDELPAVAKAAKDPEAKSITVAELLTHSSGITYDPSQGDDLNQFAPFTKRSGAAQVRVALSRALGHPPGKKFFYNNENFTTLGMMIEAVTHEDYFTYCNREVLAPVGITDATVNPPWAVMDAYGGWLISAEDYGKLLSYFAPHNDLLSVKPGKWPKFDQGGSKYGIGVAMRKNGSWFNFWHFGGWVSNDTPKASFGAYFADWGGTVGVFADYSPAISDKQQDALDSAMSKAANQ